MQFTKTVLSNGLRLLTVPMPSFESATVMLMVGAGSRYEKRKNSGVSHFLEHMAFKGTDKRPTSMDISSLIDGIGGEFNAFTGKETTGYYVKSGKNNIELCLDLLSDMIMHSKLDQNEIDKEKGVIIEEINMVEDSPMRKIGDIYEELLYGDTPMGWDIAGNKTVIQKMQRPDLISYMDSLYSADNMTVVVAGGIDEKETLRMVNNYFSGMNRFNTISFDPIREEQNKPALDVRTKATEQVHIAIGLRTVALDNPDRYPLSVLASILGGGMSSRLFHEVREKRGLAYYVSSHSDQYVDCGSLLTRAGVDPKRVVEASKVIIEEYGKIAQGKMDFSQEELRKAKEFLKGHLVLELEDSRSVASFYAHQELLEKQVENPDEVLNKIDSVTTEQIVEVGKRYFINEGLNLAVIGNFSEREKLESVLGL